MTAPDDFFDLYDLRIDVVIPPGARVLCGARPGDHFFLYGEMLHLPPGQGFSIYSLASVLPFLAAKQRYRCRSISRGLQAGGLQGVESDNASVLI